MRLKKAFTPRRLASSLREVDYLLYNQFLADTQLSLLVYGSCFD